MVLSCCLLEAREQLQLFFSFDRCEGKCRLPVYPSTLSLPVTIGAVYFAFCIERIGGLPCKDPSPCANGDTATSGREHELLL